MDRVWRRLPDAVVQICLAALFSNRWHCAVTETNSNVTRSQAKFNMKMWPWPPSLKVRGARRRVFALLKWNWLSWVRLPVCHLPSARKPTLLRRYTVYSKDVTAQKKDIAVCNGDTCSSVTTAGGHWTVLLKREGIGQKIKATEPGGAKLQFTCTCSASVSHPDMCYSLLFFMCLLQCLHFTDEARIGRNRGSAVCSLNKHIYVQEVESASRWAPKRPK